MERKSLVGGRYSLIEKLGEGATKEVYLARDGTLGRDVALCSFKPYVVSGGYIDRVRREATTLAGLNHPNVVGMFDFQDDDGWYMTTEYVAGGSLKSKMASVWKGTPELSNALIIAAEVADALSYAHARGVFHRDVKPSNIMLTPEGTAKLGDFGLAKPLGDESPSDSGLIVGTLPYMSPEQAKGLRPDSPSDMYSLGVTLFEMVTGRRPFHGDDVSVLVHHLNSTPPPPTRYEPSCPPRLETLILELLEKDPEARPTAGATAVELRRIREELSGEPAPSTAAEPRRWEAPGEPALENGPATDPTSPESWTRVNTSFRGCHAGEGDLV